MSDHAAPVTRDYLRQAIAEDLASGRFDDTNPNTERSEYVQAIKDDIRWLGCDWARILVKAGNAYACDLSDTQIREYRGTNAFDDDGGRRTPPGRDSPFRDRSVVENLDLFERTRKGESPMDHGPFAHGSTWPTTTC